MHTLQVILRPTWQKAGCISGRSLTVGSKSIESRAAPGKAVVLELDYAATWDHLGDHWHGRRLLALHLMSSWLLDRMLYNAVRRIGSGRLLMSLKKGGNGQNTVQHLLITV